MDGNLGENYNRSYITITNLLKQNNYIETLSLQNCQLNDSFAIPFADGLAINTKLKAVNLS